MSETRRRIRMYDGKLVDPFDLQPENVVPDVFLHHISLINRYTGATKYPYSVGQHSLVLSHVVPEHLARAALLHDWSEGLFNDIASPVKHQFLDYCNAEENAQRVIFAAQGVPWEHMDELHEYDQRIYIDERDVLFEEIHSRTVGLNDRRKGLGIEKKHFRERSWRSVKIELLDRYKDLFA